MGGLTREHILRSLEALAAQLPADRSHTLVVVGGAALVLLYGARDATKDVDAFLLEPGSTEALRRAAEAIADTLDLPHDWLNDGAKGYLHGLTLGEHILTLPNLSVRAVAKEQLLAMKLSAWRDDVDIADARLLLSRMTGSRNEIWGKVQAHLVPGRELKAEYAFDDLWGALHETP